MRTFLNIVMILALIATVVRNEWITSAWIIISVMWMNKYYDSR